MQPPSAAPLPVRWKLDAPGDRKRATARINWLARQLRGVDPADIELRAFWRGRGCPTQASLSDVLTDPRSLEGGRTGTAPTSFEVSIVKDLAGRFSGRKTFVEDLEKLVPEFYERIGQRCGRGRRHRRRSNGRTWAGELRQRLVIRRPTAERVCASDRAVVRSPLAS